MKAEAKWIEAEAGEEEVRVLEAFIKELRYSKLYKMVT